MSSLHGSEGCHHDEGFSLRRDVLLARSVMPARANSRSLAPLVMTIFLCALILAHVATARATQNRTSVNWVSALPVIMIVCWFPTSTIAFQKN